MSNLLLLLGLLVVLATIGVFVLFTAAPEGVEEVPRAAAGEPAVSQAAAPDPGPVSPLAATAPQDEEPESQKSDQAQVSPPVSSASAAPPAPAPRPGPRRPLPPQSVPMRIASALGWPAEDDRIYEVRDWMVASSGERELLMGEAGGRMRDPALIARLNAAARRQLERVKGIAGPAAAEVILRHSPLYILDEKGRRSGVLTASGAVLPRAVPAHEEEENEEDG